MVTKKSSTQDAHRKEMRTILKEVNPRKDSSTRVSSKLSSLQIFSAVISFLEGEVGLRIDGSAPRVATTILRKGNSSLYHRNFPMAPLKTRSGV